MKSQVSEKKEGLEEIVQLHMFVYLGVSVLEPCGMLFCGLHHVWLEVKRSLD